MSLCFECGEPQVTSVQAKPPEAKKPPFKTTETAVHIDELKIVKAKLACAQHPGSSHWRYIRQDGGHKGEHVALGLEEIGLWARKIVSMNFCMTTPCLRSVIKA